MALADVAVRLVSGQTKDQAQVVDNQSTTVPDGGIMIGFQQVDNQRQVEIVQALKQLRTFIIETDQLADDLELVGGLSINGVKSNSIVASPITPPLDGAVYIQVDGNYPLLKGNLIFNMDFTNALKALQDNYLKGV